MLLYVCQLGICQIVKYTKPDMRVPPEPRGRSDRRGQRWDSSRCSQEEGPLRSRFPHWDFNAFAKPAILKTAGAGEGPPVVRTALTSQVITSIRQVFHMGEGLQAGGGSTRESLAAVGNGDLSSLTKGTGC
jgi:hypothetical protein